MIEEEDNDIAYYRRIFNGRGKSLSVHPSIYIYIIYILITPTDTDVSYPIGYIEHLNYYGFGASGDEKKANPMILSIESPQKDKKTYDAKALLRTKQVLNILAIMIVNPPSIH